MFAFGFLAQILERWWGPMNDGFAKKLNAVGVMLTIIGGGDADTLLDGKNQTLFTLRQWECKNVQNT